MAVQSSADLDSGDDNTPEARRRPVVLFLGTSLTAGYGLTESEAYPAIIERIADSVGTPITAVNAGVSGETSAGALRRIDWALRSPADIVVVETGANDALRGLPIAALRSNLDSIIAKIRTAKPSAKIMLVQMEAPPNLGSAYVQNFRSTYSAIAREQGIILAPFLLTDVAGIPSLNQPDGIHPNVKGAELVARNIWQALAPVVQTIK